MILPVKECQSIDQRRVFCSAEGGFMSPLARMVQNARVSKCENGTKLQWLRLKVFAFLFNVSLRGN